MNEQILNSALEGIPIPQVIYFDEIDSTNEQALKIISEGAEEFTLMVAERQTAGRGRLGRKWVTTPGSSLAFTLVLHPLEEERQRMGFFSFLGGLAVCLAIEAICRVKTQVKWPNDVLLGGKKTAGILAESTFQGETLAGTALGIGINLKKGSVPPPVELMFPATCIEDHCHEIPEREVFLTSVMENLLKWRPRILEKDFLQAYQSRLAFVGERVALSPPSAEKIEGVLMGVNSSGYLVLEMDDGEVTAYPVGDLRPNLG